MSDNAPVVRLLMGFRTFGLLLLLLFAIPGWAQSAGFDEVREAVAVWQRVFQRLPALEKFVQEGKAPAGPTLDAIEAQLEEVSRKEASNPFLPLARGALLTLTKRGAVAPAAAEASQRAGDRLTIRWLLYRALHRLGEEQAAAQELKKIREIRDRQGLERIAYLAWDLARSAEARAAAGDLAGAERALTLAEEFDPALPDVFFTRARIYLQRGSPRGVSSLIRGWWLGLTSPFYGPGHWTGILASFLLALPVGLVVVGLLLILRVTPLFQHDLAEWRRRRDAPVIQVFLPITFYLLPIILGFGLLPAVCLALLPLGIYLKGRERCVWIGGVLALLLLPRGYHLLATVITSNSSPRAVALLRLEEGDQGKGIEEVLARWADEVPGDPVPRFYLGRLHRLRGELQRGIERYAEGRGRPAEEAALWTNRGNLAFLAGNLGQAQAAYEKAITLRPDFPYPHFNLSQVLTERLLLEQSQQEYARAIRRMPELQVRLQQASAEGRKRVLVEAPLPHTLLWARMVGFDPPSSDMADALWGGRFLGVSLAGVPWVVGGYLVAFGALIGVRKRRRFARACQECGKSFCPRCQRLLGEIRYCTRCAIIQRSRTGEVPPTIKSIPTEEVKDEPRWVGIAFTLIPGGEEFYRGKTFRGLVLVAAAILAVSPLLGRALEPAIHLYGTALPYQGSASVAILLLLYLVTAAMLYIRSRRGRPRERRWR